MSLVDSVIPGAPAGDLSTEDWMERITVLRAAERTFRKTADQLNFRLLTSARWPELRLQRTKGWSTAELRLTLRPGCDRNRMDGHRWEIKLVRYPRFAWLPVGLSSVETIAVLSDIELCSGDWDQDRYQDAVRRLAGD